MRSTIHMPEYNALGAERKAWRFPFLVLKSFPPEGHFVLQKIAFRTHGKGPQMRSMLIPCSRGLLKPYMDPVSDLIRAQHGPHEPLQIAEIGACGKQNDPRCACPSGQEGAPFVGEYTAHT